MDDRKRLVRKSYDAISTTWGRDREAMDDPRERDWLARFSAALVGTRVLELGCGGGVILRQLEARGLRTIGVDFSPAQLERARAACPLAVLVQADLAGVEFAPDSFDGVVIYDSLWHVPREEHGAVLERVRRWLVRGAPLLLTVGAPEEAGEGDTTLCGEQMFYAAWPREVTFELLRRAGFNLVAFDDAPDRALILLARAI
jgi:SAM-dependent methyltransferase